MTQQGNSSYLAEARSEDSSFSLQRSSLARRWISYAVGVVMGRFQPGVDGALGRGRFPDEVAAQLREMANTAGVMVLDQSHQDDLAARVFQALQTMLGEEAAREVVFAGIGRGGEPEESLRKYFAGKFFKEHIQQYRKRPVYWLLQSPRRKYGLYLFYEKLTSETLYHMRGQEFVASKLELLERRIKDLQAARETATGPSRRRLEKDLAELEEVLEDVQEFARRLDAILQRGYTPHIDDGVLINMAPLWELIPAWQTEPRKCWEDLEQGKYDWSHQAMDHWPERVREKCRTNKSYAIAHGLVEEFFPEEGSG